MDNQFTRDQDLIFNARWLTPAEIAQTFVAPPFFERLAAATHTLLVGPRGSGKTTLLKMLQPNALESWGSDDANRYREQVTYTGIFVPADISWKEQLVSIFSKLPEDSKNIFSLSAFTTCVLHALVDGALWRTHSNVRKPGSFKRVELSREREAELVQSITSSWHLPNGVPSLLSLKHRLRARLLELPTIVNKLSAGKALAEINIPPQYGFVHLPLMESVSLFIEMFDDFIEQPDAKWALLFDEMEIAPEWVQQGLFASTRSRNPKILLKIALSPFNANVKPSGDGTAPSPLNDFEQIQLWYAHRDQDVQRGRQRLFCEALWKTTVSRRGMTNNAYIALGESYALPESELQAVAKMELDLVDRSAGSRAKTRRRKSAYSPTGKWGMRFIELFKKDRSFNTYLTRHSISPDRIQDLSEPDRARLIRKVVTIVAFREYYRRADKDLHGSSTQLRSRKGAELYTGAETFFLLSEGHPRWLKVTLGRMLEGVGPGDSQVPRAKQGAQIVAFAQRFAALLKTFPSPTSGQGIGPNSVWSLTKMAGEFFYEQVVEGSFDPEPVLSFTVDARISEDILSLIQIAVNLGALVYVPDSEGEVLLSSVRGKRFRLSYWLAPLFKLPPMLGRSVALSAVLQGKPKEETRRTLDLPLGLG